MGEFEPKEISLQRTVWLFECEILEKLENTDLKDHHAVLKFNFFSMEYELNPKFDNGRADAITMRNTANHWFKIWFKAFSACSCDQQSKIEQLEKQQRINSECINNLVQQKADYLHKVTMAIAHLDSFDHSRAGMNQLVRSIESALEALRGECG